MKNKLNVFAMAVCALFSLSVGLASATEWPQPTITPGPFKPTKDSLTNYHCPEWFRNAKFGIWAHWGPQAVPMDGDWYARGMYEEGNPHYKHHLEHFGHPSTNGYKDIIALWKAEKWDPDRLMALYKKAGARYFVSMGSHHDNFELWNDPLHRWNAVNMGPKRDVVGDWKKAAQKYGLRFGVSEHLGASFTWFQSSHGADKSGPLKGVPYDGADPKNWDLYHQPAKPGDTNWYSLDPEWQHEWYARIKTLIDNYDLDLLYTDGGIPFDDDVGLSMIAHLYNTSLKKRGSLDVVYTCKQNSEGRWAEDIERGVLSKIDPYPWQTDTSIGDWYYNKNWKFRSTSWIITMLADIVSKNGNLLLNVVQRPDGSIDPEVEKSLEEIAAWNAINGEAIFDTRPWLIYGEGSVKYKGGNFNEDFAFNSSEIRFTTKGKTLYTLVLGWPEDGKIIIRSLAKIDKMDMNHITSVALLGHDKNLKWKQNGEGLIIYFPCQKPCDYVFTLKLTGSNFTPVPIPPPVVHADAKGKYQLTPETAQVHGNNILLEKRNDITNFGFWNTTHDWLMWRVDFKQPGIYTLKTEAANIFEKSEIATEAPGQILFSTIPRTGSWDEFKPIVLGTIEIKTPGVVQVKVCPAHPDTWRAFNMRTIVITQED